MEAQAYVIMQVPLFININVLLNFVFNVKQQPGAHRISV
jgi:hypothetical protein